MKMPPFRLVKLAVSVVDCEQRMEVVELKFSEQLRKEADKLIP